MGAPGGAGNQAFRRLDEPSPRALGLHALHALLRISPMTTCTPHSAARSMRAPSRAMAARRTSGSESVREPFLHPGLAGADGWDLQVVTREEGL